MKMCSGLGVVTVGSVSVSEWICGHVLGTLWELGVQRQIKFSVGVKCVNKCSHGLRFIRR